MTNKPEVAITVKAFNQEFNKGMQEMRDESSKLNREFQLQQAQMKNSGSESEKLAAKMDFLQKKHELAGKKVEETEKAYETAKEQFGENSKAAEDMAKKLDYARIEEQNLANEIHETNKALEAQESQAEKIGNKLVETGDKISGVGKGMTAGVTAPILAVGAAGLAAFTSVDEALDTVITKTGATGEAAAEFEQNFRNVGQRVPHDLSLVGEAIGEVNTQFGFMGKELEDNAQLMLEFSEINGQDVTSSSIAAKQAIEAYSLANGDLEHVLDAVTKTAQGTGQSTKDLFDKAVKGAPQIKALGLSFAEGTALIGNFEKSGVDSSAALSSLSKAQVEFAKDGKTLQDGLQETISKIEKAKDETEAMTIASEVFGTKGATRMVDAINRGTFSLEEFVSAGQGIEGTVKNTFEATQDPIDQAAIAANNAKIALADVGKAVQIALLPIMTKATDVLRSMANWFGNLNPAIQQVIIVIGGILAAIGPVLVVIGTLVSAIGSITLAVTNAGGVAAVLSMVLAKLGAVFAFITGPIGLTIAAVIALIAIFVSLYKNNEDFRIKVHAIWNNIQEKFQVALSFIQSIVTAVMKNVTAFFSEQLAKIRSFWDENGADIMKIVKWHFDIIWTYIQMVMGVIKGIFEMVWPVITNVIKIAWSLIQTIIKNALDLVLGIIKTVMKLIQGDWKGAWESIKETASKIMGNIVDFFKKIDLVQIGKDIINGLIRGISSMVGSVKTMVSNLADNIPGWAKKVLKIASPSKVMVEVGEDTGDGAVVGLKNKIAAAKKAARELANTLVPESTDYVSTSALEVSYASSQMEAIQDAFNSAIKEISYNLTGDVYLDARVAGEVVAPHVKKENDFQGNRIGMFER